MNRPRGMAFCVLAGRCVDCWNHASRAYVVGTKMEPKAAVLRRSSVRDCGYGQLVHHHCSVTTGGLSAPRVSRLSMVPALSVRHDLLLAQTFQRAGQSRLGVALGHAQTLGRLAPRLAAQIVPLRNVRGPSVCRGRGFRGFDYGHFRNLAPNLARGLSFAQVLPAAPLSPFPLA